MMTGKYHAKMVHVQAGIITTTASGLGMKVKVTDPEGKLIMDRMYGHKGTDFRKYQIVLSSRLTHTGRSIQRVTEPWFLELLTVKLFRAVEKIRK